MSILLTTMLISIGLIRLSFSKDKQTKQKLKDTKFPTFLEWKKACANLPHYIQNPTSTATPLDKQEFEYVIEQFVKTIENSTFNKRNSWINPSLGGFFPQELQNKLFSLKPSKTPIKPKNIFFVQKLIVDPSSEVYIHGDNHADIHALIKNIEDLASKKYLDSKNPFKIKKKNFYMLFVGDYVDKGIYSSELLYTIMRLKIENPEHVLLLRGNHDYKEENIKAGFHEELRNKLGYKTPTDFANIIHKINRVYNLLDSMIYVGVKDKNFTNYVMFIHAGLEPRYNPHIILADTRNRVYQWIKKLNNMSWLSQELQSIVTDYTPIKNTDTPTFEDVGFIWNNFLLDKDTKASAGRGIEYEFGSDFTRNFLNQSSKKNEYKVHCVIRSHQHEIIKTLVNHGGIYNSWTEYQFKKNGKPKNAVLEIAKGGPVWTLNVSPDNYYGKVANFNYDIYAILKLDKDPAKWTLTPYTMEIFKK